MDMRGEYDRIVYLCHGTDKDFYGMAYAKPHLDKRIQNWEYVNATIHVNHNLVSSQTMPFSLLVPLC